MCSKEDAAQDRPTGIIPAAPWRVTEVVVLPDFRLKVRFIDGTEGYVEMAHLIFSEDAGIFATLRDKTHFIQAHIELGVVTWPGEIDLAPDAMYREIKKNGKWVPE